MNNNNPSLLILARILIVIEIIISLENINSLLGIRGNNFEVTKVDLYTNIVMTHLIIIQPNPNNIIVTSGV